MHPPELWGIPWLSYQIGWLSFLSISFLSVTDIVFDSDLDGREILLIALGLATFTSLGMMLISHW